MVAAFTAAALQRSAIGISVIGEQFARRVRSRAALAASRTQVAMTLALLRRRLACTSRHATAPCATTIPNINSNLGPCSLPAAE